MDLKTLTQYASISERTVREWINLASNPLPATRVSGKILVSRTRFDKWLESHPVGNSVDIKSIVDDVMSSIAERA